MSTNFDSGVYCDFNGASAKAVAGKDILLCVFNGTGEKLMAVSGQQGLTLTRAAETIEVTSKESNGWKTSLAGIKEWSIDNEGLYVLSDETHKALGKAFTDGTPVCVKVVNTKTLLPLFGGLAYVTEYSVEAPYDEASTYSITLEGNGPLTDLTQLDESDQALVTTMPE